MKFKIIALIIIGLIGWLFVGIINKSQEYHEYELCLKYTTLQIKFNKPYYLLENSEINKYNKGRTLNKASAVVGRHIFWKPYKEHPNNKAYYWKAFMNHKL